MGQLRSSDSVHWCITSIASSTSRAESQPKALWACWTVYPFSECDTSAIRLPVLQCPLAVHHTECRPIGQRAPDQASGACNHEHNSNGGGSFGHMVTRLRLGMHS
jgi:hypothetical protein